MLVRERSVRRNGEHRDAAARIVGDDQEPAARVERLANPIGSAGRRAIEHARKAGCAIDRERGGIAGVTMHRIEKALVGTEHEVGRVLEIAHMLDMRPRAGGGVDPIDMNAVAARLALGGRD